MQGTPQEVSYRKQAFGRGLSWPLVGMGVCSLAWLGLAIVLFSTPAADALLAILLIIAGLLLACVWLVLTVVGGVLVRKGHRPGCWPVLAWTFTPLAGFAGLVCYATHWDLMLRVRLSEPALIAEAERLRSGGVPQDAERHLGLLRVYRADLEADGTVRFMTDMPWIFDEAGLFYDPDRAIGLHWDVPEGYGHEDRSVLYGPWFVYYLHE